MSSVTRILLIFFALLAMAGSSANAFSDGGDLDSADPAPRMEVTTGATELLASSRFGQPGPIDVIRAAASAGGVNSRLMFFCGSKGFVVSRGGSVFDLEGGAVVRVRGHVSVTGSYRLIGYDFRATGSDRFVPQIAGPFLALNLSF